MVQIFFILTSDAMGRKQMHLKGASRPLDPRDGARMAEACDSPKGTPQDVGDKEDGMKKSQPFHDGEGSDELNLRNHHGHKQPP